MKTIESLGAILANSCEEYQQIVNNARDAVATLEKAYADNIDERPSDTVNQFVKTVGYDVAVSTIATLINRHGWDGRISEAAKAWAKDVDESFDEDAANQLWIYTNRIHMVHLDQIARAMMKFTLEEPDTTPEDVPAVTPDADAVNVKAYGKITAAVRTAVDALAAGDPAALRVSVSQGNTKMGAVASVSLLPFVTCPARCAGTCGKDCYAAKLCNLRPSVLASYARNTAIALRKPDIYWQQVRAAMAASRWFRFHVSGDIPSATYFAEMVRACRENPHCETLVFTKRYEIVNAWMDRHGDLPDNLHILFSGWTNLRPVNPHNLPETTVYGRKETPADDWKLCGGNCMECGCRGVGCWQAQAGDTIAFRLH